MPYQYKKGQYQKEFPYESHNSIDNSRVGPGRKITPKMGGNPGIDYDHRYLDVRRAYINELEFADQMKSRRMTFSIDMRNKYEVKAALDTLTDAYKRLENEVFEIPHCPFEFPELHPEFAQD